LPIVQKSLQDEKPTVSADRAAGGTETILLVEDEEALRELTRDLLIGNGYTVLEAESPERAIEIVNQYTDPIHLLLTDIIMPGMNGCALAQKVTVTRPQIKVMYMSGYAEFRPSQALGSESVLLAKPFKREVLLRTIRDVLTSSMEPQLS
jgi:CheY-like chemotaxis protein